MRKFYFLLVLVRLYFALVPSYIHPDEHFQGPEVIVGEIFKWPSYKTWEFTSGQPIRSTFPLWIVYGPPLILLKWIAEGLRMEVSPMAVFYTLRTLMFLLSFVLEDWALDELLPVKRDRKHAIMLVASSYVTWTYQAHTFSNSIETILVLWSMVLMERIRKNRQRTLARSCAALAFVCVLGVFNRITFPAFILIPAAELIPHLLLKPLRIPVLILFAALTTLVAVAMDTEYYTDSPLRLRKMFQTAVLTPWNNVAYNMNPGNLAEHGLHPLWLHFVANLPQLIGPAFPLVIISSRKGRMFWSGIVGVFILSLFRHQEPRFLLPAVPLLLSSVRPHALSSQTWVTIWITFNVLAAILFGIYHQGGVVPVQNWLEQQSNVAEVLWWKTYSPPRWLLGNRNSSVNTTDLMGMRPERMLQAVVSAATCRSTPLSSLLVAPDGSAFVESQNTLNQSGVEAERLTAFRRHVGLDDLDFGDDGVWPTLERVIGRRGLSVWQVSRDC